MAAALSGATPRRWHGSHADASDELLQEAGALAVSGDVEVVQDGGAQVRAGGA